MQLEYKIKRLKDFLRNKKSVLAFSAGSDSTLIAYMLSEVSSDSLLVTVDNGMMPKEFIDYTIQQAKRFNLKHEIVNLNFLTDTTFQNNAKERCYKCRKLMYSNIRELPDFNEYDYFLEGTNITDLLENRPGILVLKNFNMISPLVECDITKDDVLAMINYFNLEYSFDTTCLATRIKTNQEVNSERLNMVYEAEKYLREQIKQENIRVRFDDFSATISVDEPLKLLNQDLIIRIRNKLGEFGFSKIFLDITGYEKTMLVPSVDEEGRYYYQLPYSIDLERTKMNFEKRKYLCGLQKYEESLNYGDIIIQEDGKISMNKTDEFVERFYQILGCIQRKEI